MDDTWWVEAFETDQSDDAANSDWLAFPPDHVRNQCSSLATGFSTVDQLAPEGADPETLAPPSSRLMTIRQLLAMPPTRYLVADLLPQRGLMAFFGAPTTGKSFLAIDLSGAIVSGTSHWFGRRLTQSRVAFVALEGNGGMQKRIKAWLAHSAMPIPDGMRLFTDRLSLLDEEATSRLGREIVQELGLGTVSVIDTLSRAMAGGDENSSTDMTTVIGNAELLGSITEGPVILVHHTGKDPGKGLRGHSSLLGAVDVAVEVVNDKGNRSWTLRKNKEGNDGGLNSFELVPYPVDVDQWGDEVLSCGVRQVRGTPTRSLPTLTGKNKIPVMAALRSALRVGSGDLAWDQVVQVAAEALTVSSGRRVTVAKATVESLIASGHLSRSNDRIVLGT